MNMKHYQKIAQVRKTKQERARAKIEKLDLETKDTMYMDERGNIDWAKLAKHITEALGGR